MYFLGFELAVFLYLGCIMLMFIFQLKELIYLVPLFDVYPPFFSFSLSYPPACVWNKNFKQFRCGGSTIYHIDADELFASHYDNFIVDSAGVFTSQQLLCHPLLLLVLLWLLL